MLKGDSLKDPLPGMFPTPFWPRFGTFGGEGGGGHIETWTWRLHGSPMVAPLRLSCFPLRPTRFAPRSSIGWLCCLQESREPARIAVNRTDRELNRAELNPAIHHREPSRAEAPAVIQHSDLYSGSGFLLVLIKYIGFYMVSLRLCKVLVRFHRLLTRSWKEMPYSKTVT